MAIIETTSPASSPSPAISEFSVEGPTIQRRGDPDPSAAPRSSPDPNASSQAPATLVTCEWDDCGESFAEVKSLVDHLHNGHIGVHKSSYSCEWASCPRRGLVQTSRFALVSHCRSHTGEKPFACSLPECDKSFTRSDTLAKHLRQQHNVAPPMPTRGGYRKRKRSLTPPVAHQPYVPPPSAPERLASSPPLPPADAHAPSHYNFANRTYAQYHDSRDSGFNTFRVNPTIHDRPALAVSSTMMLRSDAPPEGPLRDGYVHNDGREEDVASSSENDEDGGKPYNAEAVGGRSKAMVKYLIMKAKHRYVMLEKDLLTGDLEALKRQEREEWREKEAGVDRVLRVLGPQSEALIHEPETPLNGKRSRPPVSASPHEEGHHAREAHLSRHDHRMEIDAR